MKRKPSSYARFFALIASMAGDPKMIREALVERFTGGRTSSLREMNAEEYDAMCRTIEAERRHAGMGEEEYRREIKRMRSAVLQRLQRIGIDTTDWAEIDEFCLNKRIAGKVFRALTIHDLHLLVPKLEAMLRKPRTPRVAYCPTPVPIFVNPDRIPS